MTVRLVCCSHSPLLDWDEPAPPEAAAVQAALNAQREAVDAFDPDLIVEFGADHYTSVTFAMVPPFCIATACETIDDYGGQPGRLNVPADLALSLLDRVRNDDIDVALSRNLVADHGFSGGLWRVCGGVDRRPVLPLIISTLPAPQPPFRRSRMFGESVGRWIAELDMKVLILGTGGLSHEPDLVFPQLGSVGEPAVEDYLLRGDHPDNLGRDAWTKRVGDITRFAGQVISAGDGDPGLHPDFDRRFLDALTGGDMTVFDSWTNADVERDGGSGALEIHLWIAATAAAQAAGCAPPTVDFYAPVNPYAIGTSVVHAETAAKRVLSV